MTTTAANDWNREKVLERLSQVTLPAGLQPQMGTDWSPVGQIYWYTLRSTNPAYGATQLKSLEDWTLEKQFRSVPGVVDVSSFGGITREYQVILDPEKLIQYGLTVAQVKQAAGGEQCECGRKLYRAGAAADQRARAGVVYERAGYCADGAEEPERDRAEGERRGHGAGRGRRFDWGRLARRTGAKTASC